MDTGEWALRHIAGEHLPADLLTKALPQARFHMLVSLLGVGPTVAGKVSRCQVQPLAARKKFAALALWALSVPQMLKGCEASTDGQDGNEQVWMWLLAVALGVILLWEGAKMMARPCLKVLRFEGQPASPAQVTVNADRSLDATPRADEHGFSGADVSENPRSSSGERKEVSHQGLERFHVRPLLLRRCASQRLSPLTSHPQANDGIRTQIVET